MTNMRRQMANAAPTAAPTATATKVKDVEKAPKAPKEKREKSRKPHPLVGAKDGSYPFKTTPADFSPEMHQKLSKKDFVDVGSYFDHKVRLAEKRLEALKKDRDDIKAGKKLGGKKLGGPEKFKKVAGRLEDMRAELIAAGYNVEDLLKEMLAEKTAAKTATK